LLVLTYPKQPLVFVKYKVYIIWTKSRQCTLKYGLSKSECSHVIDPVTSDSLRVM